MHRLALLFATLISLSVHAETITGFVTDIADGDTLTILDSSKRQVKVRLAGIDAPEKGQPFGNRSKNNLADLVFNKTIMVEAEKQDRYGRTIGKVFHSGKDINLLQVRAGLAWWYEKYRKEQSPADQRLYQDAEQQARAQRVGLWSDPAPVAPWDFRHPESGVVQAKTSTCPCGNEPLCVGPKGGHYCLTPDGTKRYKQQ
ncbi:thermonuclease family protein [Azonexus sp. IMCC34839]|uniref:thermonuclease family protein n=1 Tax=Azonexus sp. IMCC34839 TaxID=3133695 RepID=UPI00399B8B8A